ncbi:hypothetical protein [Mastigocladopsis repens]|uniref:hypothetical protein n=1 Tax=Mastigocladopsis repens TaxID=221287 RepID=UPI0002F5A9AF|nr:hypothetical protein [Mastigocladopsis repens]
MPLPEGFSEWENLQDLVRIEHNKAVRAYFKNQADDDISTPKARLKHSCLIKDDDTVAMTQLRMWLFEVTVGHTQSLQTPTYGIPVQELQRETQFKPQVRLYFQEKLDPTLTDSKYNRVRAEITFRLMNETSETIGRPKAESLAREIKNLFANPVFTWDKGWYKATYLDLEHGYDLRLLVKSKTEG